MNYLLDTDHVISLTRGQHGIQEKVVEKGIKQCHVSWITLAELYVGAYRKNDFRTHGQADYVSVTFPIVPLDNVMKTYAQIRAALELEGRRLDTMDLLIAATALVGDYTLVTHNTRHFSRIPGLQIEDWIQKEGQE